jgi:signal transduction histidine kinase/DNA-binding NarL/FixJ family response regulator
MSGRTNTRLGPEHTEVVDRTSPALALQAAIVLAALALIVATWTITFVSIEQTAAETRSRAEATATNLALAADWQLSRQLQVTDQALQSLAGEWAADPVKFEQGNWRRRAAALGDIALQIFFVDSQGMVMISTRPDFVGQDMSQRDIFAVQRDGYMAQRAGRTKMYVGPATRWKSSGRWEINLSRRLEREDGSFAGAVVISYDPWALARLLDLVDIGPRGMIALVGNDGATRVLISPTEMRPGQDIGLSDMFRAAMRRNDGAWTGASAPDGIVRIHGFRPLRDQDLTIVVGLEREEAMRTAAVWSGNARLFAIGMTLAVLVMAILLIREVRAARGREVRLARDRSAIERAYGEVAAAKASAEAKTVEVETTLAGMSDGMMILDSEFRVVQWNARFAHCTGVPPDLLVVGQPMAALLRGQIMSGEFGPPGSSADVEREVRRRIVALRSERGTRLIERPRPDGSVLELRRSRLPNGGMVTLYADITARRRATDAQEAARALAEEATEQKSRLVAIVSHEIRTPLNAVINSLGLLDNSGLTPSQRRLAGTAREAGDALMELVDDILELSKAEAGNLAVRSVIYEPRTLLLGVQAMFRTEAAGRGMALSLDAAPDVPQQLRGDAGRLRQVVINLVSNAIKFSTPGEIRVKASTLRADGAPILLLSVQDRGPVIPDSEAAKLFQPFSRLDNARDAGKPGTGLGLAICERLVRLMRGDIGLRATPDGGNEFWLTVPMEAVSPSASRPQAYVVSLLRRPRVSILLVEDIPANQMITATLLRREGHRVDIADSGAASLRMIQRHPYDIVFMDLMMPGMSGYDAARQIRAMPGSTGQVPIVALTATTAPEDRARCLASGMDDLLGKPVRPQEMFAAISRLALRPLAARKPLVSVSPAEAMAPQAEVLDDERLSDLRRSLPAVTLLTLVDQCLDEMRGRMPALRDALASGNGADIDMAAHALAGMAGSYGLAAMNRRLRRIMDAARSGDILGAEEAATRIEGDLAAAGEAIRMHLRARVA